MTNDEEESLDKKVFDFLISKRESWVFEEQFVERFGDPVSDSLGRLASRKLVERWKDCPKGPAWAMTPYAAARLGIEVSDSGKRWIKVEPERHYRLRYRDQDDGHTQIKSIKVCSNPNLKAFRVRGDTPIKCESDHGPLNSVVDAKSDDPADFLAEYDQVMQDLGFEGVSVEPPRDEGDWEKRSRPKTRKDYAGPIPPPTVFSGGDCAWPIAGQRREYGPPEGQAAKNEPCSNCSGKPGSPSRKVYCLACNAYSLDWMIPTLELFDSARELQKAIRARKARKEARRIAKEGKRGPGRPRKHPRGDA